MIIRRVSLLIYFLFSTNFVENKGFRIKNNFNIGNRGQVLLVKMTVDFKGFLRLFIKTQPRVLSNEYRFGIQGKLIRRQTEVPDPETGYSRRVQVSGRVPS